ncbi:hypothetical protein ABLE68_03705 [Nocardioides sp. CN2-186]|uniref:hypothetical protein n=1 Tax=Nocardioides tweenelious TaxID=3156607 RepID=UPI0032B3E228
MASTDEARPRWFQRVLPVTALAVALVALAALVVPGFRDQVALSASHQPEPYVELYFARAADGTQLVCTSHQGSADVRFAIASHLDDARRIAYVVTVDGATRKGTRSVEPGRTAVVHKTLDRQGAYDVSVLLPASGDELSAHCAGGHR